MIEQAALTWLKCLGWTVNHGREIAPGELATERADFGQVVLAQRLLDALARLKPTLPPEADTPTSVTFAADRIPIIREASRLLREKAPITDYELEGAVVKLERPGGAPMGRVTVMGHVEGLPRRVVVQLSDPQYHARFWRTIRRRPFVVWEP